MTTKYPEMTVEDVVTIVRRLHEANSRGVGLTLNPQEVRMLHGYVLELPGDGGLDARTRAAEKVVSWEKRRALVAD